MKIARCLGRYRPGAIAAFLCALGMMAFCWASSSAAAQTPQPELCNVYGPLGRAAAGSALVWYGIHSFEMLQALMGRGAERVRTVRDEHGVTSLVRFACGRRGIVECVEDCWWYGGRVQSRTVLTPFHLGSTNTLYYNLMLRIRDFFLEGHMPVSLEQMLEVQALLDAAERALESGREEALRA